MNMKIEKNGFRWRGSEITRIEGLNDAVFAIAITLLIVSLDVPKSFADLKKILNNFIGFAFTFAYLIYLWYLNYIFYRRYGLHNLKIIIYNSILLFLIIYYIYPLKFMVGMLVYQFRLSAESTVNIRYEDTAELMNYYSLGLVAVFLLYFLMYYEALKEKNNLLLNNKEILISKSYLSSFVFMMLFAVLSILINLSGSSLWAGLIYILVGPLQTINGYYWGKKIRKISS